MVSGSHFLYDLRGSVWNNQTCLQVEWDSLMINIKEVLKKEIEVKTETMKVLAKELSNSTDAFVNIETSKDLNEVCVVVRYLHTLEKHIEELEKVPQSEVTEDQAPQANVSASATQLTQ